jgi:hypothetical protein
MVSTPPSPSRLKVLVALQAAQADVWRALDRILFAAAVMKSPRSQREDAQAAAAEVMPFTRERNGDLVASLGGNGPQDHGVGPQAWATG